MLEGPHNTGKTSTIKMVVEQLTTVLGAHIIVAIAPVVSGGIDIHGVVEYEGKKIYINSEGDIVTDVAWMMGYAEGMDCDVCILANSNKTMIRKFADKRYTEYHIVRKTVVPKPAPEAAMAAANAKDRDTIIALI